MMTKFHSFSTSSRALCAALLLGGWISSVQGQLEYSPDAEYSQVDFGLGAAYTEAFSEGWIDGLVPVWSGRNAAAGLHGRAAVGENDRIDTALGGIMGYWFDNLETLANFSAYWDHHELEGGAFDRAVVGSEFYTPLGEFRIFGHFGEDWSEETVLSQTFTEGQPMTSPTEERVTITTTTDSRVYSVEDGLEMEYGGDLPCWQGPGRARLFVGYQWWGDSSTSIEGVTARAQWVATENISLQTRYFEDPLMAGGESHWRFEVAFRFPLGDREPRRYTKSFTPGKKTVVGEPSRGLLRRPARTTWPVRSKTSERTTTQETIVRPREMDPSAEIEMDPT